MKDHQSNRTSVRYLTADLFCTLEEAAARGGCRGAAAYFLYRFMYPAGKQFVGETLMFNIRLKGRKVLEEL